LITFNSCLPAAFPTINEDRLTTLIKEGNDIKIAFNHSKCNREYNDLITTSIQMRTGCWYRVIVCTSTYAAGVNLYKFAHGFIIGNKGPFQGGIGRSERDRRTIMDTQLLQMAGRGA
jgi:replicative superfamily II helicase